MTLYNAAPDTIDRIVFLVWCARPNWDQGLVRVVLLSHALQCDGTDLAIAALRAAKDERILTPKAIGWRGPHWDGLATRPPNVKPRERCDVCGKTEDRCWERKGIDDDHAFTPVRQAS